MSRESKDVGVVRGAVTCFRACTASCAVLIPCAGTGHLCPDAVRSLARSAITMVVKQRKPRGYDFGSWHIAFCSSFEPFPIFLFPISTILSSRPGSSEWSSPG